MTINGWDERDYKFWSDIRCLPSYGKIVPDDEMISRKQVETLLKKHAEERFVREARHGCGWTEGGKVIKTTCVKCDGKGWIWIPKK